MCMQYNTTPCGETQGGAMDITNYSCYELICEARDCDGCPFFEGLEEEEELKDLCMKSQEEET